MALVQSSISDELKEVFSNHCKAQNMSESKVIRQYLEVLFSSQISSVSIDKKEPRTNKITVRFSDKMISKIDERFTSEGYETRTEWVASCVLAVLNHSAVLTHDEQKILKESNKQLAAIGRNLNQIAKAINSDITNTQLVTGEFIDDILTEVNGIKGAVSALLLKNKMRWA